MRYNDELIPNTEIMSKMNNEYSERRVKMESAQLEINEKTEFRQKAEMEDVFRLLGYCEEFLKWLEGKDSNLSGLREILEKTTSDRVVAQGCCGGYKLDYRYACDKDFNHNCQDYCKCEIEIIDKIIKILSLKHSIVDKQCMIKLLQSRMDVFKFIFHRYCK